ncbi:MAG: Co2+/Mg2+ efflux protein ApaG [Moraxellaceae bacterium]|nr:Co2+/Mg2+ efflux protein ApaG [Moraxellaceae bacterium]
MPVEAILVQVRSEYLPDQSNPAESRYVFAYHVKITNESAHAARLLTRHWIIMDGEERVQEVRGDGVVGQQPQLAPGESYEYTSGTVLETPVGSMHGSYGMIDEDGQRFEAPIPAFTLAIPRVLH